MEEKQERKPRAKKQEMKPLRARAPKRSERRMNSNTKVGTKDVLTIDPGLLDPDFEYRIVNQTTAGRVKRLMAQDWDIARISDGATVGDEVAGKAQPDGSTVEVELGGGTRGLLMCKRKDWYKEDKAAEEKERLEIEKRMQADYKEKNELIKME